MSPSEPAVVGFLPNGGGAGWTCHGALTFDNAAQALEESQALPLPASGRVDLAGLRQADSAALAVFLALRRRAEAEGRTLAFASVPPGLVQLARVYGVDALIGIAG